MTDVGSGGPGGVCLFSKSCRTSLHVLTFIYFLWNIWIIINKYLRPNLIFCFILPLPSLQNETSPSRWLHFIPWNGMRWQMGENNWLVLHAASELNGFKIRFRKPIVCLIRCNFARRGWTTSKPHWLSKLGTRKAALNGTESKENKLETMFNMHNVHLLNSSYRNQNAKHPHI